MLTFVLHGHTRPLTCVHYNYDGDLLFTAGRDSKTVVWRVADGTRVGEYKTDAVIFSIDTTYDSSLLATASGDSVVEIFDVLSGESKYRANLDGPCRYVEWSKWPQKQQDRLVVAHRAFGENKCPKIVVLQLDKEEEKFVPVREFKDFNALCRVASWGPFDETIVSLHEDGMLYLWDVETGKLLESKQIHDDEITDASLSKDRTLMLTSSRDRTAKLWTLPSLQMIAKYETDRPLNACSISPLFNAEAEKRKQHILLGGGQAAADVTTTKGSEGRFEALLTHMVYQEVVGTVKGHYGPINALRWAPDGAGFASGGEEGLVRLHKMDKSYFEQNKFY